MNLSQHSFTVTGLGQDSHAFGKDSKKPLRLGGITIEGYPGLSGNSDADVVLHALCNAISSISCVPILGALTDTMCEQGIIDSSHYVREALATLTKHKLVHIAISLECKRPKLVAYIDTMRNSIAQLCHIEVNQVGITATSGEQLTAFGQAKGIQAFVIISAITSY